MFYLCHLLHKLAQQKQIILAITIVKVEKIVSHVGLLLVLDYRSSCAMHYVKYFLKWNISLLRNTAELLIVMTLLAPHKWSLLGS